ncbi:Hypothetical predicted protein [Pelobates cultripes]|uniref:Uncharacterized protein n=1 Tax=Pelobates cultripes TaxID=61616 RepID=A0AAD1RNX2_PELCU|nr:Hypothetical predicted protein [Pelobates cultripes]
MLHEATADIKTHVATEINKQLSGLKADMAALSSRANQSETQLSTLTATTTAHTQDIYLHGCMSVLVDGLEDLNNRSRINIIRIFAPTRIHLA